MKISDLKAYPGDKVMVVNWKKKSKEEEPGTLIEATYHVSSFSLGWSYYVRLKREGVNGSIKIDVAHDQIRKCNGAEKMEYF